MTPEQFIAKWSQSQAKERSAAQEHFIDLCRLLEQPTPNEADPVGDWYCFERGATKTGAGQGWADVWKKGCFGWEYKGKGKDLGAALKQLQLYALALQSPPLLIVCDIDSIVIRTAFTNAVQETHVIPLEALLDPQQRQRLIWAFTDPERLRPGLTTPELTEQAAGRFAALAQTLQSRGHDPQSIAQFLNKLLFCLFAEDVRLLPDQLFTKLLTHGIHAPEQVEPALKGLFAAMSTGGLFGYQAIDWFNGGLFDGDQTLPLEPADLKSLLDVSRLDWSCIEPAIFGTLFERGLDPAKRSQLGAHYTDRHSILRIIDPVIREPLLEAWDRTKAQIAADKSKTRKKAQAAYHHFLESLRNFRVLDPACGSGNFLYLALRTLKDIEHQVILEAEVLGLPAQFPAVGPESVHGIEINPYAAELARVTVWIGEIQWMLEHGRSLSRNPVLRPLDTIECRDALLNSDGTEAEWPKADVIVGNPPFLGGSKKRGQLGDAYFLALNAVYADRVPGGADLVCYWFEKARAQIAAGQCHVAGLVATNSIRGGANRKVLERILSSTLSPGDSGDTHGDDNLRHVEIHQDAGSGGVQYATGGSRRRGTQGGAERPETGDTGISGLSAQSRTGRFEDRLDQMDDRRIDRASGGDRHAGEAALAGAVSLRIFNAWSDEPWVNDGAAVRVALVCFGSPIDSVGWVERTRETQQRPATDAEIPLSTIPATLDGQPVAAIHADLTGQRLGGDGAGVDLTGAVALVENAGTAFQGPEKNGAFDIPGEVARDWLKLPNPNGQTNSQVLKPRWNGIDLTRRPQDIWIIDFGTDTPSESAALFEKPFEHVLSQVKPDRDQNKDNNRRKNWWRFGRTGEDVRNALCGLNRYMATPEVAKHRLFVWMDKTILPDKKLIVIARSDETTFGILQSRIHEVWALAVCTWHGVGNDPRYTPTTTFETFPFPAGLTPADTQGKALPEQPGILLPPIAEDQRQIARAIAEAAFDLNQKREAWLNPPEWVDWVIIPEEEQAGFPHRPVAKPGHEADLKKRTLTNLYNARPVWLTMAHEALDQAVAAAYGWDDYTPALPDEEILRRLLVLNQSRAKA
jgi:hypothetical protein